MKPTPEDRETRYKEGTEKQRFLFASDEAGERLQKIFESYHMRPELYREYALAFGDTVLGFEKEENLAGLLIERTGLPEKLATILAHDLLEFINEYNTQKQPPSEKSQPLPLKKEILEVPVGPPAWSRRAEQQPPIASASPVPTSNTAPSYKKPMTDIPRYVSSDPYREPRK